MKRGILTLLTAVFVGGVGTAQAGVVANLVDDPGFEELEFADDPSTNSTPWFAIEDADNRVVREQGIINGGTNAVKLVAWKKSTLIQNLGSGFTLDSNTVYELNFYMRFDNYVEARSNDHTRVTASFYTTTNGIHGSTYAFSGEAYYGQVPTSPGVWQKFIYALDGADIPDLHGEYLQVRLIKPKSASGSSATDYSVYFDDVEFGVFTPSVEPDPDPIAVVTNWLADPGFEQLEADEPSTNSAPWFAVEDEDNNVVRTTDYVNQGQYALKFKANRACKLKQNTGLTVDTNALYAVRFDNLIADFVPFQSNKTANLTLQLFASPTPGGTYSAITNAGGSTRGIAYGIIPSATDVWEQQLIAFNGSDLGTAQGQYLQLRLSKGKTEYDIFIDNLELGEYAGLPEASKPVAPANLLIGWYESEGTNDVHADGIDGSLSPDGFWQRSSRFGSTDGSYGSSAGASTQPILGYAVRQGGDPGATQTTVRVSIENTTGDNIQLDTLRFDFGRSATNSPQDVALNYVSGDLADADGTLINSVAGSPVTGSTGDLTDYDWSLSTLSDQILADGESAVFELTADNFAGQFDTSVFDNIGIFGQAVVPPSDYLIGWHSPDFNGDNVAADDSTPDEAKPGISGSIAGGREVLEVTTGSNDGTYGTLAFTDAGASPINTIMLRQNNAAQSRLDITIVNNTGNNVSLASLNFDFNRANTTNSPQDMDVTYLAGDLNVVAGTSVFSYSGNTGDVGFNNSDYTDVDATLTNLVDHKLADGESATFRIQVSNGENNFNVRIDNIAIDGILTGTGTDYATWIGGFDLFGSPDADPDYDYDGDGWDNLMEYGLDGNPDGGTTADVTVPSLESVGGALKYIHLQRNNDASLSYYPELSDDLVTTNWANSGYTVLGTNTTLGGEFDEVTNSIPTSASKKFIRLVIEQN